MAIQSMGPFYQTIHADTLTDLAGYQYSQPGHTAYVGSLACEFIANPSNTSAADGYVVLDGVNVQWQRVLGSSASKWLSQNTWYIDGTLGNDENDGYTSGTAIKTGEELNRRLNGPDFVCSIQMTINILNNIDRLILNPILSSSAARLYIIGSPTNTLLTTTISNFTAVNGNIPAKYTATGVTDWSTAGPGNTSLICNSATQNIRGRVSGGARDGICFFNAKMNPDSGDTNATMRTHDVCTIDSLFASFLQTGDTIIFESLPTINNMEIRISGIINDPAGSSAYPNNSLIIKSLRILHLLVESATSVFLDTFMMYGCIINDYESLNGVLNHSLLYCSGCWFNIQLFSNAVARYSLITNYGHIVTNSIFTYGNTISGHNLFQGVGLIINGNHVFDGQECICDATNSAINLNTLHNVSASSLLIGYGNLYGVSISPQSHFCYSSSTVPTITGTSGNIQLKVLNIIIPWTAMPWNDGERSGTTTLINGTKTITVPYLLTNQIIIVNYSGVPVNPGVLYVDPVSITNTSFIISSSSSTDNSGVNWNISPIGKNQIISPWN